MATWNLRATQPMTYGTRRLQAGDRFAAPERDARILLAIRKAERMRELGNVPPPPPAVVEKIAAAVAPRQESRAPEVAVPAEQPLNEGNATVVATGNAGSDGERAPMPAAVTPPDLMAARADYEQIFGKRPYHGWDAATLREKIGAAKQSTGG